MSVLGRKQKINLQLTESFDSSFLAISLFLSHYLRLRMM